MKEKILKKFILPVIVSVHKSCGTLAIAASSTSIFSRLPLICRAAGTVDLNKSMKIISNNNVLSQSTFNLE